MEASRGTFPPYSSLAPREIQDTNLKNISFSDAMEKIKKLAKDKFDDLPIFETFGNPPSPLSGSYDTLLKKKLLDNEFFLRPGKTPHFICFVVNSATLRLCLKENQETIYCSTELTEENREIFEKFMETDFERQRQVFNLYSFCNNKLLNPVPKKILDGLSPLESFTPARKDELKSPIELKAIRHANFFVDCTRLQAEELLETCEEGTFLVRSDLNSEEWRFAISVKKEQAIQHSEFYINTENKIVYEGKVQFTFCVDFNLKYKPPLQQTGLLDLLKYTHVINKPYACLFTDNDKKESEVTYFQNVGSTTALPPYTQELEASVPHANSKSESSKQ